MTGTSKQYLTVFEWILWRLLFLRSSSLSPPLTSCHLPHSGWRWGRLPETDWPKERQASGLLAAADGWIRGQSHHPGVRTQSRPSCQGEEEKEKEKEGMRRDCLVVVITGCGVVLFSEGFFIAVILYFTSWWKEQNHHIRLLVPSGFFTFKRESSFVLEINQSSKKDFWTNSL